MTSMVFVQILKEVWSMAQVNSFYAKAFDSISCSAELSDWMEVSLNKISNLSARKAMRKALLIEN